MNFALRIPDYYRKDIELLKGDISINHLLLMLWQKRCYTQTHSCLEQRQREAQESMV